jgi:hypothetical protein
MASAVSGAGRARVLVTATVGVVLGTLVGRRVLRRVPEAVFRRVVAAIILVLGAGLLIEVAIGRKPELVLAPDTRTARGRGTCSGAATPRGGFSASAENRRANLNCPRAFSSLDAAGKTEKPSVIT